MSKTILVMEMPDTCKECICYRPIKRKRKCYICGADGALCSGDPSTGRNDWCPLMPAVSENVEQLIQTIRHCIKQYNEPPYGREIEGTVELLEEVISILNEVAE